MHCPGCGQQQVSEETKFCSRCGLPLGLVSEILAHGGFLPQLAELYKRKKSIYTRKNGLAFSLIWCLFFLFIMTPLLGILRLGPLPGVTAVIGIFGGLILVISSLIYLKNESILPNWSPGNPAGLYGQPQQSALPPQQSVPASAYVSPPAGNWRDTNELQPTSVTESTTKLLSQDDK